jgi:hypothetical protein
MWGVKKKIRGTAERESAQHKPGPVRLPRASSSRGKIVAAEPRARLTGRFSKNYLDRKRESDRGKGSQTVRRRAWPGITAPAALTGTGDFLEADPQKSESHPGAEPGPGAGGQWTGP